MDAVSLAAPSRHIDEPRFSPAFWEAWLAEQDIPALPQAAWLPAGRRMVVLAPHPDDEVLACGALLHSHVASGGSALIVAATDGENSHAGDRQWPPHRLAGLRRNESDGGLHALGAAQVPVVRWGLPDGAVAEGAQWMRDRLDRLAGADDIVVTTWRRDGHPDHEACADAAAEVCSAKGCLLLEAPVWMWHWADPAHPDIPWPDLRKVPASAHALACKQRAVLSHASQLAPRSHGRGPVLDASILRRAQWPVEYFFASGAGSDGRPLL